MVYKRYNIDKINVTPYYLVYRHMSDVSFLRCLGYTVYTTKLNPKILGKLDEIATTGIFLGLDKKSRSPIIMDRDSTLRTSYPYLVSSSKAPDIMPDDHVNDRESGYSSPMEDDSTQKSRGPWRGCASGCVRKSSRALLARACPPSWVNVRRTDRWWWSTTRNPGSRSFR